MIIYQEMSLGSYFVKSPIAILTVQSQCRGIWSKYCDIYSLYHLSHSHPFECTTVSPDLHDQGLLISTDMKLYYHDRFFSCIAQAWIKVITSTQNLLSQWNVNKLQIYRLQGFLRQ